MTFDHRNKISQLAFSQVAMLLTVLNPIGVANLAKTLGMSLSRFSHYLHHRCMTPKKDLFKNYDYRAWKMVEETLAPFLPDGYTAEMIGEVAAYLFWELWPNDRKHRGRGIYRDGTIAACSQIKDVVVAKKLLLSAQEHHKQGRRAKTDVIYCTEGKKDVPMMMGVSA